VLYPGINVMSRARRDDPPGGNALGISPFYKSDRSRENVSVKIDIRIPNTP
jgi:hypothetical protein